MMARTFTRVVVILALAVAVLTLALGPATAQPSRSTPAGSASSAASGAPAASAAPGAAASSAAPATSSSPAPGASGAAPASTALDGAAYAVRLRDLEQRIDELKEQIRRSHTRLSLLSDTILGGGVAGSRAEITFVNEMSGAFRLTRAVFILDNAVQYNKSDDSGSLSDQRTIPVYSGAIPPGDHTLQVLIELRGNGYGVFSYLRGYKFEVRSSHSFTVVEGKAATIQATAYEKGGVTTPLEERPAIRYLERIDAINALPGAAPQPSSGSSVSGGISIGGK